MLKKTAIKILAALLLASSFAVTADSVNKEYPVTGNGTSAPPMGFNTWYVYLDGWTQETIKDVVRALEAKGLRDLGYQYIQLDWGWCTGGRSWYEKRTESGKMNPDPWKFTSPVPLLANYLHRRGFRIGYYTDTGYEGVGEGIGSAGHYEDDINQFVGWQMDFLKVDSGGGHPLHDTLADAYAEIFEAIINSDSQTGVPVCLCGIDVNSVLPLYEKYVGDKIPFIYYRVAADISSSIPKVSWDDPTFSVLTTFDAAMAHPEMSRPGLYFDMDTLMLENNGLNDEENRSYFTMFCIAPSTLFLAVDIPNMSDKTLELVSNEEAIAVNQDPLCNAARLVREDSSGLQVYSKVQSDEKGHKVRAVMLFNRTGEAREISVNWKDIGLDGNCFIRDIWQRADIAPSAEGYVSSVPSHGVVFLKITEEAVDPDYKESVAPAEDTQETDRSKNGEISVPAVIAAAGAGALVIVAAAFLAFHKKKKDER